MFRTALKFDNIEPDEFKKIRDENDNAVVIDCRTKGEIQMGHLDYDLHLDIMDPQIRQKIEQLDKSKTYLIYCRSGNRSGSLCNYMASQGFEKLYNLAGGIISWY